MDFRNSQVDKPRAAAAEKSNGPQGAPGKETEVELVKNQQQAELTENTDVGDEDDRTLETSFKHLWSDYSADWKDTRRYPGDGAAAPHRKLCMSLSLPLVYCLLRCSAKWCQVLE